MLSANDILPEISTSTKVVFFLIVCEAPQECQSHAEEAAAGTFCRNPLTGKVRNRNQMLCLSSKILQGIFLNGIKHPNELTSGFHRWLCPAQLLDENSLGCQGKYFVPQDYYCPASFCLDPRMFQPNVACSETAQLANELCCLVRREQGRIFHAVRAQWHWVQPFNVALGI